MISYAKTPPSENNIVLDWITHLKRRTDRCKEQCPWRLQNPRCPLRELTSSSTTTSRTAHEQITEYQYKRIRMECWSNINMSRLLAFNLFFLAFAAFAIAAPTEEPSLFTKILKDHKDILPSEVVEAYQGLSAEEKEAVKDVFKNYKSFKNEEELITALKAKSPELGEKAEKLQEKLQTKIKGLSAEPKAFIEELIAGGRGLYARSVNGEKITSSEIKLLIETQVTAYKALPTEAKEEIKKTFSGVAKFLEDDKVQTLLAKVLEKTNEEH